MDTDQIVRADLRELRDMNMKGAPYGYTPFCDSNKDMEGFRYCTLCIQLQVLLGSEMWGGLELLQITMSKKGLFSQILETRLLEESSCWAQISY